MKQEIADILMRKIKDPRVGFVTVTDVDVADDLRNAKVFVSIYGGDKTATLKGLESASAFIRSPLAVWDLCTAAVAWASWAPSPTPRWPVAVRSSA